MSDETCQGMREPGNSPLIGQRACGPRAPCHVHLAVHARFRRLRFLLSLPAVLHISQPIGPSCSVEEGTRLVLRSHTRPPPLHHCRCSARGHAGDCHPRHGRGGGATAMHPPSICKSRVSNARCAAQTASIRVKRGGGYRGPHRHCGRCLAKNGRYTTYLRLIFRRSGSGPLCNEQARSRSSPLQVSRNSYILCKST